MQRSIILVLVALVSAIAFDAPPCTTYISSEAASDGVDDSLQAHFNSLRKAADHITRQTHRHEVVCLGSGTHFLGGATLQLNASHNIEGGSVLWRSVDDNKPAVLAGGVQLTTWYRCDDGVHCPWPEWHGVWVHMVADIPNITAAALPIRQLWVNGSRVARSTMSTASLGLTVSDTGFRSKVPLGWSADDQIEFRWPSQIKNWIEPRCIVTGVDGLDVTVEPACWQALTKRNGKLPPVPLWVENIPGPPSFGQFYATPKYIFYRPQSTEEYSMPTNAWAPLLGSILIGDGLENHHWQGVRFAHGTWRQPSLPGGFVPSQSLVSAAGEPPGAVQITRSRNVSFKQCMFDNIGSAYALSIGEASRNVEISRCTFSDCSGGAIKLGNVNDSRAVSTDPAQWDTQYLVENNLMENIALEFRGAAAVFAGYVAQTTVAHNTLQNTGYTGISLGWGWGTHVKGPQTFARNNHILGNRLTGVMSALNDGGCTYTLGPQPDSTVSGNFCEQDRAPVVGCFYHDNGSRYFTTENNVADTSPAPCVYLQGCCNSPAYDIAVRNLWCRSTAPVRNGCEKENCTIDKSSLHILSAGVAWPSAAQAIIDASGVQPLHDRAFVAKSAGLYV